MIGTRIRKGKKTGKEIKPEKVNQATVNVSGEVKKAIDLPEAVANLMNMEPKVWRDLIGGLNDETPEDIAEAIVNSVNTHPLMLSLNNTMRYLRSIASQVISLNQKLDVVVGVMMGSEEKEGTVPNDIPEVNQLDLNDLEGLSDNMMLMNQQMFKEYSDMKAKQAEELAVAIVMSADTDPLTKQLYLGYMRLRNIVKEVNGTDTQLDKIVGLLGDGKRRKSRIVWGDGKKKSRLG